MFSISDNSWSNVASSQPPSASVSSIPAWTRIENQPPSAGRGALRAPATRPKVYAGALNPPGASQAPMPPPAWQMQMWQGGRGVASQMSALNLND